MLAPGFGITSPDLKLNKSTSKNPKKAVEPLWECFRPAYAELSTPLMIPQRFSV